MTAPARAIEIDGQLVRYVVVRSRARRRSVAIRLEADGSLMVRAPLHTPDAEVESVLALRTAWITRARRAMAELPPLQALAKRATLPYLGGEVTAIDGLPSVPDFQPLPRGRGAGARGSAGRSEEESARALIAWYRAAAGQLLPPQVAYRAAQIGQAPKSVVISRQRHAWGSCGRDGTIRLSYRLMMLPPELIDCVIVHELCHLAHHNHSPAFWSEVARWQPQYKALRAQLKHAGLRMPF